MSENVQNTETLSPEQRRAIEALAAGSTKELAAAAASRTRRTVDRWIAEEPAFRQALQDATDQAVKDAARRLTGLMEAVIDAIVRDLDMGLMEPNEKLRALDLFAKHAVKLRELAELEERVTALEERINHD